MNIIYTKSYDSSKKYLKNHHEEQKVLKYILDYLKNKNAFVDIINDPISKIYGFERLKYEYNEFYSFRLSKLIRLIVKPKDNDIELYLIYISMKHYDDFNIKKVIYYAE